MFNFIVTATQAAWDKSHYKMEANRFGEYTAEPLKEQFDPDTEEGAARLLGLPTLFAYETF